MPAAPRPPVSGRYRGSQQGYAVELRVDVDRPRPTMRVSADYFRVRGDAVEYHSSMLVDAPQVRFEATRVTIRGTAVFSTGASKRIRVTIPRVPPGSSPPPATLHHVGSAGPPGATYVCQFESDSFRRVELEEACERGVTHFRSYDTGSLASGGPRRTLTTVAAFAEAGVEMVCTDEPTVIDTSQAGPNTTWSDAELHAAMESGFSRWRDRPVWAVWMLHATDHDDPGVAGLMFDQRGSQRQGCAVFYGPVPRSSPEILRDQLHTCVHELGHAFNLLHSWQKSRAVPPIASRPASDSWMNYPDRFPGKAERYWPAFAFQFDEPELVHLRHGFQPAVIMGGAPLLGGAALRRDDGWDAERQDPGLRLRLIAPRTLAFGVPVTVGAELSATTAGARQVPVVIGPQAGSLDVLIRTPSGDESVFAPLLRHCRGDEGRLLRARDEPIRSQPFIHYGQDGLTFPTPGSYTLRARFAGADGRTALSDPVRVRTLPPVSRADREIDRLISGDEQVATLMTLMGSDAPQLRAGDDKLREIIERHPTHPAAAVARLVRGTNLGRTFKSIAVDGTVTPRAAQPRKAAQLIGAVIDVAAIGRSASATTDAAGDRRAVAAALARTGKQRGIAPSVGGFVASRRTEITAVRAAVRVGSVQRRQPARIPPRLKPPAPTVTSDTHGLGDP